MGDWSQLPSDLSDQIIARLTLPDLIRFGCVCTSWNRISAPMRHKSRFPWLIFSSEAQGNEGEDYLYFFSHLDEKFYKTHIPDINNRSICASSAGWLMTFDSKLQKLQLIHPFSKKFINLPSYKQLNKLFWSSYNDEYYYEDLGYRDVDVEDLTSNDFSLVKAVISTEFSNTNIFSAPSAIVVIGGDNTKLVFCRPQRGDKKWKLVATDHESYFRDVIYYKGKFYAVHYDGRIDVVEGLNGPNPYTKTIVLESEFYHTYLAESSGDLLKISRIISTDLLSNRNSITKEFKVMKLDFGKSKWVEVKNIGDHALFLGCFNQAFSVRASEFYGCRANCIYFTEDLSLLGPNGNGIFNLDDRSIETLFPGDSHYNFSPPTWYALNHC